MSSKIQSIEREKKARQRNIRPDPINCQLRVLLITGSGEGRGDSTEGLPYCLKSISRELFQSRWRVRRRRRRRSDRGRRAGAPLRRLLPPQPALPPHPQPPRPQPSRLPRLPTLTRFALLLLSPVVLTNEEAELGLALDAVLFALHPDEAGELRLEHLHPLALKRSRSFFNIISPTSPQPN